MKFNLTILIKTIVVIFTLFSTCLTANAINLKIATSPASVGSGIFQSAYLDAYFYLNVAGESTKPSFQVAPKENPAKSIAVSVDENLLYASIISNAPIIIYQDSQYHDVFKAGTGAVLGTYSFMAQAQYCTTTLTWGITYGGYYTATPSQDCNFPETM